MSKDITTMHDLKFKFSERGFTLIELMIVVGILALLVAFAVPAYKDYTIRSKVAECVNEAAVAKLSISEYRQTLGAWPPNHEAAGLDPVVGSNYCIGINNYQASTGSFTIDVDEAAVDPALSTATIAPILTPYLTLSGLINWVCSRGATDEESRRYLPSTCRSA